jgi:hypothetical protein
VAYGTIGKGWEKLFLLPQKTLAPLPLRHSRCAVGTPGAQQGGWQSVDETVYFPAVGEGERRLDLEVRLGGVALGVEDG